MNDVDNKKREVAGEVGTYCSDISNSDSGFIKLFSLGKHKIGYGKD